MRSRTAFGAVLTGLGVLLVAAAAVLNWMIVPSQKQLPADTNTTRQYEGTAKVLLNPQALLTNDLSKVFLTNVPVTASRTVKVVKTEGDAAEVNDSRTLMANGQVIGKTEVSYAVNRKTLEFAANHNSDWNVANHTGLTVSWPIGAEKKDYTGWVNETQTTTAVRFVREEARGGINTYVYETSVSPSPIKDTQVLSALPPALPVATLAALATVLPLPDQMKAQLALILPTLTQPVQLAYSYQGTSTYWVEPTTGIVVDSQREDIRKVGLVLPGAPSADPIIPVFDVVTQNTAQSLSDAAADAKSKRDKIDLYEGLLPLSLLGAGALALIIGIALLLTSRRARGTGQ